MKTILFTTFCVALLLSSCTTTTDAWESLNYEDYSFSSYTGDYMFEDYDNYCGIYMNTLGADVSINSQEEFQELLDLMQEYNCEWYDTPTEIDFENYTLLSNFASGTGCETYFHKEVLINNEEETVTYTVTVDSVGGCEPYVSNQNWILVEKIPADYSVEFLVENRILYYE